MTEKEKKKQTQHKYIHVKKFEIEEVFVYWLISFLKLDLHLQACKLQILEGDMREVESADGGEMGERHPLYPLPPGPNPAQIIVGEDGRPKPKVRQVNK